MTTTETIDAAFETTNPSTPYTFKWVIENFLNVTEGFVLRSPEFLPMCNESWYATLQKKIIIERGCNPLRILLCFYNSSLINTKIILSAKILDISGDVYSDLYVKEMPVKETNAIAEFQLYAPAETDNSTCGKRYRPFEYGPVGKCALVCNIIFNNYDIQTETSTSITKISSSISNALGSELMNAYRSGNFSDVTLKVQESSLFAHKVILSARSEVFRTMFQIHMKEQATNVIEITDIEPHILELLLEYMYSGVCPQIEFDSAQALYRAADKYCVLELKRIITDFLLSHITIQNAVEMLFFAHLFGEKKLSQKVVFFVKTHKDKSGILESLLKFTGDKYKSSYTEVLRLLL